MVFLGQEVEGSLAGCSGSGHFWGGRQSVGGAGRAAGTGQVRQCACVWGAALLSLQVVSEPLHEVSVCGLVCTPAPGPFSCVHGHSLSKDTCLKRTRR